MRNLSLCLLLVAACGGAKPPPPGRPEDVAKAAFEALKAGALEPLEPHLMTADERRKITGVELDDSAERERWQNHITQQHEQLNVDWETAVPGATRVKYDTMGIGANVTLAITSSRGTIGVDVAVTKVGRRFVFADLKARPAAEPKQPAPESGSGEGGG